MERWVSSWFYLWFINNSNNIPYKDLANAQLKKGLPTVGIEPTTLWLKATCSTSWATPVRENGLRLVVVSIFCCRLLKVRRRLLKVYITKELPIFYGYFSFYAEITLCLEAVLGAFSPILTHLTYIWPIYGNFVILCFIYSDIFIVLSCHSYSVFVVTILLFLIVFILLPLFEMSYVIRIPGVCVSTWTGNHTWHYLLKQMEIIKRIIKNWFIF